MIVIPVVLTAWCVSFAFKARLRLAFCSCMAIPLIWVGYSAAVRTLQPPAAASP